MWQKVVSSYIERKRPVLYFMEKIILAFTEYLLRPHNYSMRQELVTLQADWLQSLVLNITMQYALIHLSTPLKKKVSLI